jgi:hypothetical protein
MRTHDGGYTVELLGRNGNMMRVDAQTAEEAFGIRPYQVRQAGSTATTVNPYAASYQGVSMSNASLQHYVNSIQNMAIQNGCYTDYNGYVVVDQGFANGTGYMVSNASVAPIAPKESKKKTNKKLHDLFFHRREKEGARPF